MITDVMLRRPVQLLQTEVSRLIKIEREQSPAGKKEAGALKEVWKSV